MRGERLQVRASFDARVSSSARRLSWCEGSDDCFEARLAPQRVPEGIEAQIAVSNVAPGEIHCLLQTVNGVICVSLACINDREILNHPRASDGVFADGD